MGKCVSERNWSRTYGIKELREKREEYGVSQLRFAVACGISRKYYNRIEKGKQPLRDELKETMTKQIERFNPREPLFLLIDYFRIHFPTTDALAVIRDVLQLNPDYMLYEDYGRYGYENQYVIGDINVMCSMQEHLGVLLELKSRGCRQMESYLLAQERSWYDFINGMKRIAMWMCYNGSNLCQLDRSCFHINSIKIQYFLWCYYTFYKPIHLLQ